MHLLFPGLLALSHQHHGLAGIAQVAVIIGIFASVISTTAFKYGMTRLGWILAAFCLGCLIMTNGIDIGAWGWTCGLILFNWIVDKTSPKYDVKYYGFRPMAYLLFYYIGGILTAIPILHYWEHLPFRHYWTSLTMLIIGPVLVVIGGVMHYRTWQLPPPPIIQQNEKARKEKAHLI